MRIRSCRTNGTTWILHGLWPQPRDKQYCDVPKAVADRARTPRLRHAVGGHLQDMRKNLQPLMSDAAAMAPHEWYAHGTCSGVTPDVYFSDAVALTVQARKILDPMFTEAEGGDTIAGCVTVSMRNSAPGRESVSA